MRFFQRFFVALAVVVGAIPFMASGAQASNPIDGSSCGSWIRVIDVSSYQPNIDWNAAKSAGVSGAWIKATEGTGYINPSFGNQKFGAASVGLPWGGYDFATPSDNAVQDATYFVQAGGASGTLAPVLDLEQSAGQSEQTVVLWATWWANTVRALTGRQPLLYTGGYYPWSGDGNLPAAFPLGVWVAAYPLGYTTPNGNSSCGLSPYPNSGSFNGWAAWQYTSVGQISGIAPSNVDVTSVTPTLWSEMTGGAAVPSSSEAPASTALTVGSTGTSVIQVQSELNFWQGSGLTVDGQYGPATASAVASFQANVLHVNADGVWGPATQSAYDSFTAAMTALAKAKAASDAAAAAKAATDAAAAAQAAQAAAQAKAVAQAAAAKLAFDKHCQTLVLRPGTTSTCVGYAQTLLVARGFPIPIDNTFGKKTLLATINIQTLHHIKPVTGVIGAKTWKVIAP